MRPDCRYLVIPSNSHQIRNPSRQAHHPIVSRSLIIVCSIERIARDETWYFLTGLQKPDGPDAWRSSGRRCYSTFHDVPIAKTRVLYFDDLVVCRLLHQGGSQRPPSVERKAKAEEKRRLVAAVPMRFGEKVAGDFFLRDYGGFGVRQLH